MNAAPGVPVAWHRRWAEAVAAVLLLAALALTLWVYAPGMAEVFLLDDKNSVASLARLEPEGDRFGDVVRAERSGPLGRPIAAASFVFERVYLAADGSRLKRSNVLLHGLAGLLVCWLSLLLLQARDYPHSAVLAVSAMSIWLLAPLQVSTVLYTVQRMAILAAVLVFLALVAYLKCRRARDSWARAAWAGLCISALIAAPFAKENGLLALPLLLVVERFWLRGSSRARWQRPRWFYPGLGVVALGLSAVIIVALNSVLPAYAARRFDLGERLLTQPWVLWDYIRQFYWPDMARLGVYHDDFPVRSLQTDGLGAILPLALGAALLLAALFAARRRALAGPALLIAFFLVAHGMESTLLPLEIYFEHRNYLPSFALALLPVLAVAALAKEMPQIAFPGASWLALFALILASKTGAMTQLWSNEALLAVHQVDGHPQSSRASVDMASLMARLGGAEEAYRWSERAYRASLSQRAAREQREGDFRLRNLALACEAGLPPRAEDLQTLAALDSPRPIGETYTLEILTLLYIRGGCAVSSANAIADAFAQLYLREPRPERASYGVYVALATLMNELQRIDEAATYVSLVLAQQPNHARALLMQLHFARILQRPELALESQRRLRLLQRANGLTARQVQTLSLYNDYLQGLVN